MVVPPVQRRVGRLAPQIGDYDDRACPLFELVQRRKTCPTNRGLRPISLTVVGRAALSEDLPHKSGITTWFTATIELDVCRKTCPTNRGLRQVNLQFRQVFICRKTCPTNRGLRHPYSLDSGISLCRKTCPTNRGLRLHTNQV